MGGEREEARTCDNANINLCHSHYAYLPIVLSEWRCH
jgi:hypothetical protein